MPRYYVRISCNGEKVRTYGGSLVDIMSCLSEYNKKEYVDPDEETAEELWKEFVISQMPERFRKKFMQDDKTMVFQFNYELVKRRSKSNKRCIISGPLLSIYKLSSASKYRCLTVDTLDGIKMIDKFLDNKNVIAIFYDIDLTKPFYYLREQQLKLYKPYSMINFEPDLSRYPVLSCLCGVANMGIVDSITFQKGVVNLVGK